MSNYSSDFSSRHFAFSFIAWIVAFGASAQTKCTLTSTPVVTPFGTITRSECGPVESGYTARVNLDDLVVLSEKQLYMETRSNDYRFWVFTSAAEQYSGCPRGLHLIDFGISPPKVTLFGVRNSCNEFHWASWGKKRSVIALKRNVKFTYENGKMTLPPQGEALWDAIEPPHAGEGITVENAIPFAEALPLPKR